MKKQFSALILVCSLIFATNGCNTGGKKSDIDEDTIDETTETEKEEVEESEAKTYERLDGNWSVRGIYWESGGVYHRDKLIDINDDDALASLYKGILLSFSSDGTFMYMNLFMYSGTVVRRAEGEETYILTPTTKSVYTDGEFVDEEYTKATKYLVTFLDENTFEFVEYDPISGKAKASDNPLVFVKNDTKSVYVDTHKIAISKK